MKNIRMQFIDVNKLIMERINQGLSRRDLSFVAGVDRKTIVNFERSEDLRSDTINKIFEGLKLDVCDYLKGKNETKVIGIEDIYFEMIKEERKKQGMTKKYICDELGMSRKILDGLESGKKKTRIHNVARITNLLGYRVEAFEKV